MRVKKPTLKRKVQVYESLLHALQLNYSVAMNREAVTELLDRIDRWSYAHRCGNGQLSDAEQQRYINQCFEKLNAPLECLKNPLRDKPISPTNPEH